MKLISIDYLKLEILDVSLEKHLKILVICIVSMNFFVALLHPEICKYCKDKYVRRHRFRKISNVTNVAQQATFDKEFNPLHSGFPP